ncbi:class I SAM-dependent rRNA methyltransferase [Evtepia sp.]|uniref:class I SAM-dependent rRNA methyltransferase n=1 Tax=Evtepia sp. TaxID=2773933 RepID=UPI00399065D7
MANRPYPVITVNEKAARSLRAGHPWVYGAETSGPDRPCQNGDLVDVVSQKGRWLGTGLYNNHSKILVRLLSRNTNDRFDQDFWRRRLRYALDYRKTVMGPDYACCRLIFGEADQFPGLTVDRFGDILVTEVLSLGMEVRKDLLYPLLVDLLREDGVTVRAIYERSDAPLRDKEGLPKVTGFYPLPGLATDLDGHLLLEENGIRYDVDYIHGQKTGFFLDQKYNRRAAAALAPGRKVLDCFTHTGAFALNCAQAGAAQVTAVDISQEAVALTRRNAALNGLEGKVEARQADVFDLLTQLAQAGGHPYDYIILDPPAFTKSGATVKNAFRGYKEINYKAMKLLPRGGYLATCSCSHFMTPALFCQMLREAAADAAVSLRQIADRRQAPDHPILWGVPETEYLKFYLFQVI